MIGAVTDARDEWRRLERSLASYDVPRLVVPPRGRRVIVTAPHAVEHVRAGDTKRPDMWTGGLALLVAGRSGAGAVVELSGEGDPSWQAHHPFKDAVTALDPAVVIDLHAMRSREPLVEIGTGEPGGTRPTPLADLVRTSLEGVDIATVTDHRFPARGHATITQWARQRGIDAVQLEVSVQLVPPFVDARTVERLVVALVDAVQRAGGGERREGPHRIGAAPRTCG
jgi:hypothetical protein